jgi:hypothetical protein
MAICKQWHDPICRQMGSHYTPVLLDRTAMRHQNQGLMAL